MSCVKLPFVVLQPGEQNCRTIALCLFSITLRSHIAVLSPKQNPLNVQMYFRMYWEAELFANHFASVWQTPPEQHTSKFASVFVISNAIFHKRLPSVYYVNQLGYACATTPEHVSDVVTPCLSTNVCIIHAFGVQHGTQILQKNRVLALGLIGPLGGRLP